MTHLEKYCDLAIDKYNLFQQKDKLLLACSGGKDSTAVFHYLLRKGYNFEVAHINYNLRSDSIEDEKFVNSLSENNNIEAHIKRVDNEQIPDSGVQEWARILRYDYFHYLASANGYDYIITAHSLDDYLESYMMNIGKGRNLWNGPGISISRGNIKRPLLLASTEQVYDFLQSENLDFREDKSNKSDKYERNRIRKYLIPTFKKQFPDPESAIRNLIHNNYLLHSAAKNTFEKLQKRNIIKNNDSISIEIDILDKSLLESFLMDTLLPYGFHPEQIDQIVNSSIGSEFNSSTHEILRDRNQLHLRKLKEEYIDEKITDITENDSYDIGNYTFTIENVAEADFPVEENTEFVAVKKEQFPLKLRIWEDGDKFQPLGMEGHKKIKSFLTDLKIDRWTKEKTYVLEDTNEEILWVVPYRISEKVKVDDSDNLYKLKWTPRS